MSKAWKVYFIAALVILVVVRTVSFLLPLFSAKHYIYDRAPREVMRGVAIHSTEKDSDCAILFEGELRNSRAYLNRTKDLFWPVYHGGGAGRFEETFPIAEMDGWLLYSSETDDGFFKMYVNEVSGSVRGVLTYGGY